MKVSSRLSAVVAAILSHAAANAYGAASVSAPGVSAELQEVVVTATRRSESLQDVPITMQALTGASLSQLNVQTFDDYIKFLPNVTSAGQGPGQNQIYMRGLSAVTDANQVSGSTGPFPNVAVYLDDQPVQLPGRNLDVYAVDLERIEVLEGPQGTLYGAGAQAGAIRYITKKPQLNTVEVGVEGGYATTAHGDPSTKITGHVNLSLIPDKLAVRVVLYDDERGGYIHNIPSTFQRTADGSGIQYYFGGQLPPGTNSLSNAGVATNAYNPVAYKGIRVGGLYQFNDDWSLLVQESYQKLTVDGVFSYDPTLGDLNVAQYNQTRLVDKFTDTAWTLSGRLGALSVVYTGGYLDRNVDGVTDYTAYANGFLAPYYQCTGGANFASQTPGVPDAPHCYSPSATWRDVERNIHQTHELRLSTPAEHRLRAIGGLFYENFQIQDSGNFLYGSGDAGFLGQKPMPGTTQFDPSRRPNGDAFFNDITRGYKQKAAFGEVAFDLLPKQLTVTAGIRVYSMDTYEKGSTNSGYGCRYVVDCTDGPFNKNLDALHLQKTFSGNTKKLNVSWKVTDQALLYLTYSEGFRPGGFNRGQGVLPASSPLYGKFTVPQSFDTDGLKNKEFGWKTTWLDHRLQFNGAVYQEDWTNVLFTQFDPRIYGNLVFTSNGPNYRVRGLEEEATVKLTRGLTVTESASWNSSSQVSSPFLYGNDGLPVVLYPTAGPGSRLAQSPPFQGNIRARYEREFVGFTGYLQAAAQHSAHSLASVTVPLNYDLKAYSTFDAAVGFTTLRWSVEAYGENLSDKRAELYKNPDNGPLVTATNRPRTIGLRVTYLYSDR
jgi:iron complex outermembrane recepter protein